jgi:hypothetical protein
MPHNMSVDVGRRLIDDGKRMWVLIVDDIDMMVIEDERLVGNTGKSLAADEWRGRFPPQMMRRCKRLNDWC